MKLIKRLWKEEEGQGLSEYALILAAIVGIAIVLMIGFSGALQGIFNDITSNLGQGINT